MPLHKLAFDHARLNCYLSEFTIGCASTRPGSTQALIIFYLKSMSHDHACMHGNSYIHVLVKPLDITQGQGEAEAEC